jgi:D-sedoheptulose 7-phosphate isomerase
MKGSLKMRHDIERYWQDLAIVTRRMPFEIITLVAETLLGCHERGGTIFVLGNGGSAATASHFVCDLTKGTLTQGLPAFRAVALTDNMPLLTAWANDTSYTRVFAEQLAALARPGDIIVAISASGNSPNVLAAAHGAHAAGASVVALTGPSGGRLAQLADLTIHVPAASIEQVEDAHLIIAHCLCVALREHLRTEGGFKSAELADRLAEPQPIALEVG